MQYSINIHIIHISASHCLRTVLARYDTVDWFPVSPVSGVWGSLNFMELAMPTTLIKSRVKAFNLQQGRCIYCELPMWTDDPQVFAKKYKITIKQAKLFQCTAEHLKAKQDGGKDVESNIVAACHYCNQKRHKCKSPKDPIAYKQHVTKRLCKGKWNFVRF